MYERTRILVIYSKPQLTRSSGETLKIVQIIWGFDLIGGRMFLVMDLYWLNQFTTLISQSTILKTCLESFNS